MEDKDPDKGNKLIDPKNTKLQKKLQDREVSSAARKKIMAKANKKSFDEIQFQEDQEIMQHSNSKDNFNEQIQNPVLEAQMHFKAMEQSKREQNQDLVIGKSNQIKLQIIMATRNMRKNYRISLKNHITLKRLISF